MEWLPKTPPRKVDQLDSSRAEWLDPEIVEEYFKLLNKTLKENRGRNVSSQL